MPSPAYRGRHRAPAGRHHAAGDAFRKNDPTPRSADRSRLPRFVGAGYLLPAAAAATLVLTATGAHIGGAVTGSTNTASTASGASAALLNASGLATEDPIQRDLEDRAARSSTRTSSAAATGNDAAGATDATPSSAEEQAKYDAEAAGAVKAQAEAQAAAQAQADAAAAEKAQADAQAKAQADAQAKAQADAAAAHSWVKFIDGGYDLTSGFGMRWGAMHPGQDFAVPTGTPVKAMSSGTVIFAGWQGGYGNKVEIQYWDGTVSWFAHNSKLLVSQGEKVTPGEVVSMSGNTGHSTGPHIHVEVHPAGGSPIPPIPWLTKMGTMP